MRGRPAVYHKQVGACPAENRDLLVFNADRKKGRVLLEKEKKHTKTRVTKSRATRGEYGAGYAYIPSCNDRVAPKTTSLKKITSGNIKKQQES